MIDSSSKVVCKCGMTGCLEALASGYRIANLAKELFYHENAIILRKLSNNLPNNISAEIVAKAAMKGDLISNQIYEQITEYLCMGIGIIANLLNP